MAECPCVDRSFIPTVALNQPREYLDDDGTRYIYYEHDDGFGNITTVQFCKVIGRKRDVFQCLNEAEWRRCEHCRNRAREEGR